MLDQWEDITEEFKNVTSKLGIGVLIHDKEFTLHDGMTAVEMMHPQMDIGSMRSQTRPVMSPEEYAEKGLIPWSDCSYQEIISVFDHQLAAFVSWFQGESLAQTIFACIHMHAIDKTPDKRIRFISQAVLKASGLLNKVIADANVFDDDEFQPFNFGFQMAQSVSVTSVLNNLKEIEDGLIKKSKSNNDEERSGWTAVLNRIRFLKTFLSIINILSSINLSEQKLDDRINQHFQVLNNLLPAIKQTQSLGGLHVTHEDGVSLPMGFEPLFNQQMLPPTFQRDKKILPNGEDVINWFSDIARELKLLTKMVGFTQYQQFLDFFREFSDLPRSILSRSMAFVIYLPENRRVLGKFIMCNTVIDAMNDFLGFKVVYEAPQQKYVIERSSNVFWQIIQIYCFNQSRQREKIEFELESLGSYMREVTAAFTAMERTSEGIKEECYYGWVALQGYKLMENYLDLGFKLDLYSDYELEYINWYLSEIICHSIVKMYSYFQDVKKVILKSSKKKQKDVQCTYIKDISCYQIKFLVSRAYSVAIRLFAHEGQIKTPKMLSDNIGDRQNLRYTHRFAPFMYLKDPNYIAWDHYKTVSDSLVKETSLDTAIQLFKTAKQKMAENNDLSAEFPELPMILMKNIIVCNVLNSPAGKLKTISLDYEKNQKYPLFKLS